VLAVPALNECVNADADIPNTAAGKIDCHKVGCSLTVLNTAEVRDHRVDPVADVLQFAGEPPTTGSVPTPAWFMLEHVDSISGLRRLSHEVS